MQAIAVLFGTLGAAACGSRSAEFDRVFPDPAPVVGLNQAVAILDDPFQRVVILEAPRVGELRTTSIGVGQNVTRLLPGVDADQLLVLSRGVQPRRQPGDELPSLSLIDTSGSPELRARYELVDPFSNVTQDPMGQWVVLSAAQDNVVTNPNQLVLIDITDPDFEPFSKTIRSFGSAPERLQFTPELDVPGGARRFLIVETSQDIALVDLQDVDAPEITVGLPQSAQGGVGVPAQVVFDPGEDDAEGDARIAIRLEGDSNIVLIDFSAAEPGTGQDFNLTLNLVDVTRPAAAIAFVTTDDGLRLAALVPGTREATLIHPGTTAVERVSLPVGFDQLRRVPRGTIAADDAGDTALLWSTSQPSVGFWALGRISSQAFRSVETLNLETTIQGVLDVPGGDFGFRKLLAGNDARFFVLDLRARESFPMFSDTSLSLVVAPNGLKAWAFQRGTPRLAQVDLDNLQPLSLEIERPIDTVVDIEARAGGRALLAVHQGGGVAVTMLDAEQPDTADTRFFAGLLFEGAP